MRRFQEKWERWKKNRTLREAIEAAINNDLMYLAYLFQTKGGKRFRFHKEVVGAILATAFVLFLILMLVIAIAFIDGSTSYADGTKLSLGETLENFHIPPGGRYNYTISGVTYEETIHWAWVLDAKPRETVTFWLEDHQGNEINRVVVGDSTLRDAGSYTAKYRGTYQLCWRNNGNETVQVFIEDQLSTTVPLGGSGPFCFAAYVLIYITPFLFLYHHQKRRNFVLLKRMKKKHWTLVAVVLVIIMIPVANTPFSAFTYPAGYVEREGEEVLEAGETWSLLYSRTEEGDAYSISLEILEMEFLDSHSNAVLVWINNSYGSTLKQSWLDKDNVNNLLLFKFPAPGDYVLNVENTGNSSMAIRYHSEPLIDWEWQFWGPILATTQILFVVVLFTALLVSLHYSNEFYYNQEVLPLRDTRMQTRICFSIGNREKHDMELFFNRTWRRMYLKVDGDVIQEHHHPRARFQQPLKANVGSDEKHDITIEWQNPRLLPIFRIWTFKIYVDGELVTEVMK